MKVFTKWPALVPAIRRAGHEPVLLDSEVEKEHDEGCVGHHCTDCGECLLYDPRDPEMRMPGESISNAAKCETCREEDE